METFEGNDRICLTENTIDDWHVAGETGTVLYDEPEVLVKGTFYRVCFDTPDNEGDRICWVNVSAMKRL